MFFAEYLWGLSMIKRNKLILSLATIIFVAISIFVSLVAVFAEENEIIRNVNASCKVYNADCHVSANFTMGGKTKDFTISGVEDDEKFLTFDKTDATKNIFQEKMLKPTNDIVLTKENSSVVFEFKFANFDYDGVDITVCLEGIEGLEGLDVKYSKNGAIWKDDNLRINLAGTEGVVAQETSYYVRVSLVYGVENFSFNQNFEIAITNQF
jgi:hypothetical protein